MESYNAVFILKPDILIGEIQEILNKIFDDFKVNLIRAVDIEYLGLKKLAYPIKEIDKGFYVQVKFKSYSKQIAKAERICRVEDKLLKFIFIREG